jgi:hypothetical protein
VFNDGRRHWHDSVARGLASVMVLHSSTGRFVGTPILRSPGGRHQSVIWPDSPYPGPERITLKMSGHDARTMYIPFFSPDQSCGFTPPKLEPNQRANLRNRSISKVPDSTLDHFHFTP